MDLQMLDDSSCQLLSSKHLLDDVCRDDQPLTLYEMSPVQPLLPVLVETTLITTPVAATLIKVQTATSNTDGVTCIPTCQTGQYIHSQLIMSGGSKNTCTLNGAVNNQATISLQSTPHIVTIQVPESSLNQSTIQFTNSLPQSSSGLVSSVRLNAADNQLTGNNCTQGKCDDKVTENTLQIEQAVEEVTASVDNNCLGKTMEINATTGNNDLLSCVMCGKHFVSIGRLKSHEKTHTKSRPFKCIDCGKTFTVRYSLICHTRVHTRERPYTCNICGSRFSQASSLKTHQIYKHTKNFPYACRHCGRGFISPGQRHEHVARNHSKGSKNTRKGKNFRKKKVKETNCVSNSVEQCEESSSFDLTSSVDNVTPVQDSFDI